MTTWTNEELNKIGAAEELRIAALRAKLPASPVDVQLAFESAEFDAVAEALQTALGMPLEERCERWRAMMAVLRRNSITAWRESFLGALRR